jgi:protein phosphatase
MKTHIGIGNDSSVGIVRTENEDYYGAYCGSYGNLIIVCDGMGGHRGGATASRTAVEEIKTHFDNVGGEYDGKLELRNALMRADAVIKEKALQNVELRGMGSTAALLLVKNDQAFYAHVGDSRIYLIRRGQIHQLTKDHSLVQQLVDSKIITEEAARDHPKKNVLVRSLGSGNKNEPDVAEPVQIFKNDRFVLCTDGLTNHVTDEEIKEISQENQAHNACKRLIQLANERGGSDNITIQIVDVVKGKKIPAKIHFKRWMIYAAAISAFIVLILLSFFAYKKSGKPQTTGNEPTAVSKSEQNKSTDKTGNNLEQSEVKPPAELPNEDKKKDASEK